MSLCALLVFCAIAGVFGRDLPLQPTEKLDHRLATNPDGFELKDLCFFGKLPTSACDDKCREIRLVSYCYRGTNECLCKPSNVPISTWTSDADGSVADHVKGNPEHVEITDEPNNMPIILSIQDFERLRPFIAGTEDEDYEQESKHSNENSLPTGMHPAAIPIYEDDFLWSKEHLAMVLIVTLILALVAVELCIIYRKKKANYLQNVFKRTSLNEKLVVPFK